MPGVDEVASSPERTAAATPASCALGLRIAHIAVTVEGLSDELRQGLADLLRPFVVDDWRSGGPPDTRAGSSHRTARSDDPFKMWRSC